LAKNARYRYAEVIVGHGSRNALRGGLLLIESIPAGAHLEGAEKQPEILILSEKEQ